MNWPKIGVVLLIALQYGCASSGSGKYMVHARDVESLESVASASLARLYESHAGARQLGKEAKAVLVFPRILKAGLTFGGQYGEGVLFEANVPSAYYNSVSASFGLQAGVQSFGYALLITNEQALENLKESKGWELGLGPSLVIADRGIGRSLTTTTVRADVYAFVYDQKGLMAGSGLQGTKISEIHKDEIKDQIESGLAPAGNADVLK